MSSRVWVAALKLNGKDNRLTRQYFLALARTIAVSAEGAETAIAELTARVAQRAKVISLPEISIEFEAARTIKDKVIGLVLERCKALAAEGN